MFVNCDYDAEFWPPPHIYFSLQQFQSFHLGNNLREILVLDTISEKD